SVAKTTLPGLATIAHTNLSGRARGAQKIAFTVGEASLHEGDAASAPDHDAFADDLAGTCRRDEARLDLERRYDVTVLERAQHGERHREIEHRGQHAALHRSDQVAEVTTRLE